MYKTPALGRGGSKYTPPLSPDNAFWPKTRGRGGWVKDKGEGGGMCNFSLDCCPEVNLFFLKFAC